MKKNVKLPKMLPQEQSSDRYDIPTLSLGQNFQSFAIRCFFTTEPLGAHDKLRPKSSRPRTFKDSWVFPATSVRESANMGENHAIFSDLFSPCSKGNIHNSLTNKKRGPVCYWS